MYPILFSMDIPLPRPHYLWLMRVSLAFDGSELDWVVRFKSSVAAG
jgi:hypothetical protein